jgi:hypothetical protein
LYRKVLTSCVDALPIDDDLIIPSEGGVVLVLQVDGGVVLQRLAADIQHEGFLLSIEAQVVEGDGDRVLANFEEAAYVHNGIGCHFIGRSGAK